MVGFFRKSKKEEYTEDSSDDYLSVTEMDLASPEDAQKNLDVRVFVLDDYEHIRDILDIIRGEKTMCLIDIHLLRNKDPDELRRSVDKIKKTQEAVSGDIVMFDEKWILAAPKSVKIHKGKQ